MNMKAEPRMTPADTLILHFWHIQNRDNTLLLFKPPNLWYFAKIVPRHEFYAAYDTAQILSSVPAVSENRSPL